MIFRDVDIVDVAKNPDSGKAWVFGSLVDFNRRHYAVQLKPQDDGFHVFLNGNMYQAKEPQFGTGLHYPLFAFVRWWYQFETKHQLRYMAEMIFVAVQTFFANSLTSLPSAPILILVAA